MVLGGITLIIYNGIAIRKGAFVKADVVQPIMQELQNLNIDGAIALCEQYKLPVTAVMKGGLVRIQDDELDIESIEKGLEETSGLELAKPFTWINLLNTIGSIAPMIGLLGTVVGMIGAFTVLQDSGMGGESSQKWPETSVAPMDDRIWSCCGHSYLDCLLYLQNQVWNDCG